MMRFTLDEADSLYLLVMPNSDRGEGFIRIDAAKGEVWGYNPVHRIYQGWATRPVSAAISLSSFRKYRFVRVLSTKPEYLPSILSAIKRTAAFLPAFI
jgi:hypothetical protein